MKRIFILCLTVSLAFCAQSQLIYLKAILEGSQEVPPTGSLATGIVIVKYNSTNRSLLLVGDYQNLAAAATDAHIHSPAPVGSNAGVLVTLSHSGGTTGTLAGSATLSASDETDLLAGNMYVNVHNSSFPSGEIRGQLTVTTSGQTEILTARIQGAQQVPPTNSAGTGFATALLDKTTGMVYLTGSYTGLTTAANAAHIHTGAPNTNGGVIINFSFSAATSGTIHVASPIGAGDQALMVNGNTYVNIHTGTFGGGEVRGQLMLESQLVFLKAIMEGSQQVPPVVSPGKGTIIVKYNTATKALELVGDYQGLTDPINASHIHSPAPPGSNAGVIINLANTGGTSGVLTGSATLTAPQESDLLNGLMYVNVHNATNPGGEIRGQLTATTPGHGFYFTGSMTGAQEVPPTGSAATGSVTVLADNVTNEVFLTGNFSGLTANASDAHIHEAVTGVDGSVIVTLSATAATSGTVTGNAIIPHSSIDAMINGQSYVNIHNASFPGGEIRAQLGNLILPVKLTYFNGYRYGNKVALVWESAEELNLREYEIEQVMENGSWMNKAVVVARGGNTATRYSFLDDPVINRSNFVLYRLKIKDADGKFSYSPVIRINFKESKAELSINANPVLNNQLKFVITGLPVNSKQAEASIIDFSGKVVARSKVSVLMNNTIDVSGLASGMYRLVVRTDENILQQSFVK